MIEVRIPRDKIRSFDNSVLQGQFIMNRLRESGAPVIGVLFPIGVEHGVLESFIDPMFDELVYRWSDAVPE